jgi:hypothetical protein
MVSHLIAAQPGGDPTETKQRAASPFVPFRPLFLLPFFFSLANQSVTFFYPPVLFFSLWLSISFIIDHFWFLFLDFHSSFPQPI